MALHVALALEGLCPVITLSGSIDAEAASSLADVLGSVIAAGGHRLVLDFADVTFFDGAGVAVIGEAVERIGRHRARIVIAAPRPRIARYLEFVGLADQVGIAADTDLAILEVITAAGPALLRSASAQQHELLLSRRIRARVDNDCRQHADSGGLHFAQLHAGSVHPWCA
jgi:anti-anti-sigma factor